MKDENIYLNLYTYVIGALYHLAGVESHPKFEFFGENQGGSKQLEKP